MMTNFFSKKLLVYFVLIMISTNLYAKPKPGKQNLDLKPFEIILNKYFDICTPPNLKIINTKFDQNSINEMKKLVYYPEDEVAINAIDNCRGVPFVTDSVGREVKNLTRDVKVKSVYYNSNLKVYVLSYFFYKEDLAVKSPVPHHINVKPKKDSNGNIVWKILG